MIRVLHMIASLDVGGSQTMMMNIYRKIDREKIQFDFVIDRPAETYFAGEIRELGGRVYTLPAFRGTNAGEIRRDWNNFFYTHPEYRILHSHVRSYASLYLPVARAHGVKTIIHSHSTSTGGGVKGAVKSVMQLPLRHQADVLMACSRDAGEWLYGKRACQSERFVLLPNGIDTDRFLLPPGTRERYRRELGLEGRFVIGNVGRFYDVKNHTFLLDVFAEVRAREPRASLLLVGVGPLQQQMAQKAVDLPRHRRGCDHDRKPHRRAGASRRDGCVCLSLPVGGAADDGGGGPGGWPALRALRHHHKRGGRVAPGGISAPRRRRRVGGRPAHPQAAAERHGGHPARGL